MTLRGPAHPDMFRVQVGRYGDRYYHDPLPADGTWDATDDQWPSVSIVKNAWPKNLGPWMAQEAARFAVEHRDTWVNLPADAAVDMIAKASDRTRNKAADRGTGVHTILEGIAEGREPHPELMPDVAPYLPVLLQLVADLDPEFIYSEVVCISRSLGYGGTADAAIRINAGPLVGTYGVDWKGLATFTPLPTPTGWTTMAAVEVGDQLLGADGRPCNVTGKSEIHERPCYRVLFDDGTSLIADNEHLWQVNVAPKGTTVLMSTEQMAERVFDKYGHRALRVMNAAPLELPDVDLPVPPYTLGAWLGDGCRNRPTISKPSDGMWDAIEADGYSLGVDYGRGRDDRCRTHSVLGLAADLRAAGVLERKAIPDIYLRASRSQRLDLLRGLMDTDGWWNKVRNHAGFDNTDKALALGVYELVCSLGWRASWYEGDTHGFGKDVHFHRVSFRPFGDNPFKARAESCAHLLGGTAKSKRRMVKSVSLIPTVPTQCVEVDSPGNLYLAGESMIPTHNSRKPGRHDAHRDECAQLAAYSRCDYIIAEVDGQAQRMAPPALDGGLIVSITPDDYRLYPVDLDAAWATWIDLREFHDTTKATIRGKHVVIPRRPVDAATVTTSGVPADPFAGIDGGKVPPAAAPPAGAVVEAATPAVCSPPPVSLASQARIDWCRDRLVALVTAHPDAGIVPPEGVPTFRQAREDGHRFTDDEIDAWVAAIAGAEADHAMPFPDSDPGRSDVPPPPAPAPVDPAPPKIAADDPRLASLATRVNALPPDLLAMFEAEAVTARRLPKFHRGHGTETQLAEAIAILEPLEEAATARRLRIDLSLSLLAAHGVEPIRALRLICDRDASRLNVWEAESLDDLACAVAGGVLVLDGTNVVASEGAETTLLNHVGELAGTKTAGRSELLAVARTLAARRQLPAARATKDVLASPLLVAAVAMTETLPASAA